MMSKKISDRLKMVESEIKDRQRTLEEDVAQLKKSVSQYDAFHIATFLPGEAGRIGETLNNLRALKLEKEELEYFLRDE